MLTFRIFKDESIEECRAREQSSVITDPNNNTNSRYHRSKPSDTADYRKEPPKEYLITQILSVIKDHGGTTHQNCQLIPPHQHGQLPSQRTTITGGPSTIRHELWYNEKGITIRQYKGNRRGRKKYPQKGKYNNLMDPQRRFGFNIRELFQWDQRDETESGWKYGLEGCPRRAGCKCNRSGWCPYEREADSGYGFLGQNIGHVVLTSLCFLGVLASVFYVMFADWPSELC